LLQLGLADRYLRVLIEPDEEEAAAALATAEAMLRVLDEGQIHLPRVMHGFGAATWPVLEAALECGCDIRIDLEDTVVLPDGRTAKDNAELMSLAVRKAEQKRRYP
jgi:uncharacterized protein (DUF849 family)